MNLKLFLPALLFLSVFASCIKDKGFKTYTIYRPEYTAKPGITESTKIQSARPLKDLGSFVLYGQTMYINEKNKGIHVIDYSIPSSPVNKGFIPIPGNLGLAIKNDILYADCYCDLFVFRIYSNEHVEYESMLKGTFPARLNSYNADTNCVKLILHQKDTTVSLDNSNYTGVSTGISSANFDSFAAQSNSNNNPSGSTSVGSSMAVFAIVNNYLYTVDDTRLRAFSLSDAFAPVMESQQTVSWGVETIFPFQDKLFIGSTSGMFIYNIQNPGLPSYLSRFSHARVCDPVIADDNFAFITLRNGTACGGSTNQLDVLNIQSITSPFLIKSFPFSNPHGLSKDGNVLFVCDGSAGLKVLDASNVNNLVTKQSFEIGKAIDVVALDQLAFVMLDNAIKIYSYDQQFNIQLLSTLVKD